MNKSTFRVAVVVALVAVLASAFTLSRTANADAIPAAPSIAPSRASAASQSTLKAIGSLVSANQVTLAFQAAGRVKEIQVKEGNRVQAGARLAALDTSMLELQVAQAQAALDAATANYDKIKAGPTPDDLAIAKSNLDRAKAALDQAQAAYDRIGGASNPFIAMSPQALALQQAYSAYQAAAATYNLTVNHPTVTEFKVAQAQVAQAHAALDLAKQNIENAIIVAPFDGTVLWVTPKVGESAAPGAPAITLADLSHMQVRVGVDENSLPLIKAGQAATIAVDAVPGKTLAGKVSKIGILATTTAGIVSVPVTLDIDATDAPIYPGLSATVEINVGS